MVKKLSLRPQKDQSIPAEALTWIETRNGSKEIQPIEPAPPQELQPGLNEAEALKASKPKRITFDVPEGLHKQIKMRAADKGMNIRELMMDLLAKELDS